MSFILDALRKSESRRRSGQAPQLDDHQGDHPATSRRRWPTMRIVLLAVALPVLIAAVAVFYFEPGFLDRDDGARTTAESSGEDRSGDGDSGQDPKTPEPDQLAMARSDESEAGGEVEQSGADDDATETRRRRRRVRTPPPEDDDADNQSRAEARERIVTDPDEAMEEIRREVERAERRMAQPEDGAGEERRIRTEPPADQSAEEDVDAVAEEGATGDDESLHSGVAEYVRAWELPLAVRREMPDLNLSIHVFAPEAEKRFVLINGERRVAGDELGGGARLVEIRREGALIDFRDHRFLLEP